MESQDAAINPKIYLIWESPKQLYLLFWKSPRLRKGKCLLTWMSDKDHLLVPILGFYKLPGLKPSLYIPLKYTFRAAHVFQHVPHAPPPVSLWGPKCKSPTSPEPSLCGPSLRSRPCSSPSGTGGDCLLWWLSPICSSLISLPSPCPIIVRTSRGCDRHVWIRQMNKDIPPAFPTQ